MKISEVIEMSKEKPLSVIAKDHLEIGEKTARKALNRAGCYATVGQAGWHMGDTENADNLHKSIYEFADLVKQEEAESLKQAANVQTYEGASLSVLRKRHSFDLDVNLMKRLKLKCVQEDITLYEAVENAIKQYLEEDKSL